MQLVTAILQTGFNPNITEGCGATPLTLAVLQNNIDVCKILVENFANIEGHLFVKLPSPKSIAKHLGYNDILEMFDQCLHNDSADLGIWNKLYGINVQSDHDSFSDIDMDALDQSFQDVVVDDSTYNLNRKDSPQLIVGDGATTKTIRSARHNSLVRYSKICEFSGDFHCSGYFEECFAKAQGPGGLYHVVNVVLGKLCFKSFQAPTDFQI